MATLSKNIFTVCLKENNVSRVYSANRFFEINEDTVTLTNPSRLESTLAWALENFTINENGIEFYYDIKANSIKHFVTSISEELQKDKLEESVANQQELADLNENLSNVKSLRKEHKLANNEVAISEADSMIASLENKIQELKKSATYVKYSFDVNENKAYANNREVVLEDFADQAFATGHISYKNKDILTAFEIAAKNFNGFTVVENLVEVIDGDVKYSTFRVADKGYSFRNNTGAKLEEFREFSPIATIDYIVERTGKDLSFLFEDILTSKEELKSKIDAKLQETYELIAFLKDQKNILADANKNIMEIKEADKLINGEIAKFEAIVRILENDELTKNDGYMNATLDADYDGAPEGTQVKVDALDYTSASKDDMITVMVKEEPMKVIKRHINLNADDSI
jgi:predicted nuclease with TOPRIM domain